MRHELPDLCDDAGEAIVYVLEAEDESGDIHSITTRDGLRAVEHHDRLAKIFGDVRGNDAFEMLIRPSIGLIRDYVVSSRRPN